jgi:hypothetical protein
MIRRPKGHKIVGPSARLAISYEKKVAHRERDNAARRAKLAAKRAAEQQANPKYKAKGQYVEGVWMASGAEAERYRQLLLLAEAGTIENLKTQPRFNLMVNNHKIAEYRADFAYDVVNDRGQVLHSYIEDVKGLVTPEFRLKHKLFKALYPSLELSIIEVGASRQRAGEPRDGLPSSVRWMRANWTGRLPEDGSNGRG